jgi:hypothetical protein
LDVYNGNFYLTDSDINHGLTTLAPSNAYLKLGIIHSSSGGARFEGLSTTDYNAMTITAVMGTTNPTDATPAMLFQSYKSNGTTGGAALASAETAYQFDNYATHMLTILGSGNVGIGTTSPATKLDVNGTITQTNQKSCATGLTTDALGSINGCVASDQSLKTNIQPAQYPALSLISQLIPKNYKWKDTKTKDDLNHTGFIAQDLEKIFPLAVTNSGLDKDGKQMKGVDSNALIALLVKAIQEQNIKIQELEEKQKSSEKSINSIPWFFTPTFKCQK